MPDNHQLTFSPHRSTGIPAALGWLISTVLRHLLQSPVLLLGSPVHDQNPQFPGVLSLQVILLPEHIVQECVSSTRKRQGTFIWSGILLPSPAGEGWAMDLTLQRTPKCLSFAVNVPAGLQEQSSVLAKQQWALFVGMHPDPLFGAQQSYIMGPHAPLTTQYPGGFLHMVCWRRGSCNICVGWKLHVIAALLGCTSHLGTCFACAGVFDSSWSAPN